MIEREEFHEAMRVLRADIKDVGGKVDLVHARTAEHATEIARLVDRTTALETTQRDTRSTWWHVVTGIGSAAATVVLEWVTRRHGP